MMTSSGFSKTEVEISVLNVPSTTSETIIVTSLVFFDIEQKVSGSMALSVSGGDASFTIGASDNAVAWTTVQKGLATGFSIKSRQEPTLRCVWQLSHYTETGADQPGNQENC